MKHYKIECSLSPQIHNGDMAYYWQITMYTADGNYAVAHGWKEFLYEALGDAYNTAEDLKLV